METKGTQKKMLLSQAHMQKRGGRSIEKSDNEGEREREKGGGEIMNLKVVRENEYWLSPMVAKCILLQKRDQSRNSLNPKCVTERPVKMQRRTASKEGAQASMQRSGNIVLVSSSLLLASSWCLPLKLIAVLTKMDGWSMRIVNEASPTSVSRTSIYNKIWKKETPRKKEKKGLFPPKFELWTFDLISIN